MPTIILKYPVLSRYREKQTKEIIVEFAIGQVVVLRTDPNHLERMVVGWYITDGGVKYYCAYGAEDPTYHFSIELDLVEELVS